jgi:hypothetical protein
MKTKVIRALVLGLTLTAVGYMSISAQITFDTAPVSGLNSAAGGKGITSSPGKNAAESSSGGAGLSSLGSLKTPAPEENKTETSTEPVNNAVPESGGCCG